MDNKTLALIRKAHLLCMHMNEATKSGEIVMLEDTAERLDSMTEELLIAFGREHIRRAEHEIENGVNAEKRQRWNDEFAEFMRQEQLGDTDFLRIL